MSSPDNELKLEQQKAPEGSRISVAYHPGFARFYHEFYSNLIHLLYFDGTEESFHDKRFPIGLSKKQTDFADFYAVLETDDFQNPDCVIAPVWFDPPMDKSLMHIMEIADAFTQTRGENGASPLTDRFIALFPDAELRQDDNTPRSARTYWKQESREANTARILANVLKISGVTEAIILDPHSEKAMRYFKHIDTLCLTADPFFADWLIANDFVDDNTDIVALDLGTAQKCLHLRNILASRTGFNVGLSILDKKRRGHSEIGSQSLVYGNPYGKRAILRDDRVASAGSILKSSSSLVTYGCTQVVPCITHGVLRGKYVENIAEATETGIIPAFAITNSLPQSSDAEFLPVGIEVLPVEHMLAFFGREVALRGIEQVRNDPEYQDYILTPQPKEQVLKKLQALTA